jgi:hypothetical protein
LPWDRKHIIRPDTDGQATPIRSLNQVTSRR